MADDGLDRAISNTSLSVWRVPGCPRTIFYSAQALAGLASMIRRDAGSSEGLLFGQARDVGIDILAARPLDHQVPAAGGQAAELEALHRTAENAKRDREVAGMEVIGWYRRLSFAGLTDGGVALLERSFPWTARVVMLVDVEPDAAQAIFLVREPNGRVYSNPVGDALEILPMGAVASSEAPTKLEAPAELFYQPPPPSLWSKFRAPAAITALVGLAVAGVAGYYWYFQGRGPSTEPGVRLAGIALRVVDRGGQLVAVWDPRSQAVQQAVKAAIEFGSGTQRARVDLDRVALAAGEWTLPTRSTDARVRMEIDLGASNGRALEVTRYAGRKRDAPGAEGDDQETAKVLAEAKKLEERLAGLISRNDELERRLDLNAKEAKQNETGTPPAPVPPAVAENRTGAASPAAPPTTPAAEPAKAYSGPRSGRAIWTGYLPAGGSVSIEGRQASTGSLNSALPTRALRVRAYPAELSSGGLIVYSASNRHAGGEVTEPGTAQSGWLATRYVYDPARARAIQITALPAADAPKLQIRGSNSPVTALVIEWEIAEP